MQTCNACLIVLIPVPLWVPQSDQTCRTVPAGLPFDYDVELVTIHRVENEFLVSNSRN